VYDLYAIITKSRCCGQPREILLSILNMLSYSN